MRSARGGSGTFEDALAVLRVQSDGARHARTGDAGVAAEEMRDYLDRAEAQLLSAVGRRTV